MGIGSVWFLKGERIHNYRNSFYLWVYSVLEQAPGFNEGMSEEWNEFRNMLGCYAIASSFFLTFGSSFLR